MTQIPEELRSVILLAAVLAAGAVVLSFYFFFDPLSLLDPDWLTAAAILLGLSILSTVMALRISEGGSTSSLDFVPQLAAVLLIGPAGASALALISESLSEVFFYRKPRFKKIFNTAQVVLSVAAAGAVYVLFDGEVSLTEFDFANNFPPFIVAIITYFSVNTVSVSYVVSVAENESIIDTWREMSGNLIFFDFAMSLLAVGVALLYVEFGWMILVLTVIPLFGLRYSYGTTYELRDLNDDLLRLFVKTIEAQDPYTSGHSVRVSESARLIAKAMKCNAGLVRKIEKSALVHDIGKIDVAYLEILRQKGPLTPEQRELIRAHPERGVEILRSIRSLHEDVLLNVLHHHERWDGEGYPSGLGGTGIPLGSRIIMVCDTIDAMTTARPYRDPLPMSVVREELLKHKGKQFDPEVVDVVLDQGLLDVIETSLPAGPAAVAPRKVKSETGQSDSAKAVLP
jgi:putative nucleotidyltransferase with HDIG domain